MSNDNLLDNVGENKSKQLVILAEKGCKQIRRLRIVVLLTIDSVFRGKEEQECMCCQPIVCHSYQQEKKYMTMLF